MGWGCAVCVGVSVVAAVGAAGETVAMTTAMERAVDALSDPSVGLPDALRALLVVSRRIEATELTTWLRGELDGYGPATAVPAYREGGNLPVHFHLSDNPRT
jgi:hypothetical protein